MERVVVTGMGLISCLGTELDEVSSALRAGRSGIRVSEERRASGFRSGLTTALPELDPKAELERVVRRYMPDVAIYGALAANRGRSASRGADSCWAHNPKGRS